MNIAVVGSGVVGTCCAIKLAQKGHQVALIGTPQAFAKVSPKMTRSPSDPNFSARTYALNNTTCKFLEQIGGMKHIFHYHSFTSIEASVDDLSPILKFSSAEIGLPALGIIVEQSILLTALYKLAREQRNLRVIDGWVCGIYPGRHIPGQRTSDKQQTGYTLELENADNTWGHLLIGADGLNSPVRRTIACNWVDKDYQQTALVFLVRLEYLHNHTAKQWFYRDSVLAFLPLAKDLCSVIWSCSQSLCKRIIGSHKSKEEHASNIEKELKQRGHRLSLASKIENFPLKGGMADRFIGKNLALIGDAAHSVHPLAGQGCNLGIEDINDLLWTRDTSSQSCFSQRALKRYEIRAIARNTYMKCAIDSMFYWAKSPVNLLRHALRAGFFLTTKYPPLKHRFMRWAGGRWC